MQHPPRSDSSQSPEDAGLPSAVCSELWALIIERLNGGEVLITDQQFQAAFEEDYRQLTGASITPSIRRQLSHMIAQVNRHHPETYVAKGVQNGVSRAFGEGVRTLNWNTAKVQEKGARSIQRFAKQDNVRDLLEEINVPLGDIDALNCIQNAVEELAQAQPATPAPLLIPSLAEFEALSQSVSEAPEAKVEPEPALVDPDVQLAIETGEIDEKEVTRRTEQADKRQAELEVEEMAKVPQNLAAYVADGKITDEEAGKIKALREVDERLEEGEIDEEEASHIRNSILSGQARDELDKKIKEAVDHSVRYVQVFESMQKISLDYDAPLQFLIRHKQAVLSEQSGTPALAEAIKGLMEDAPILGQVIDVMERKDQEIRMLSVRLPPYNYIMGRNLERIGNATIEEDFVEELRFLKGEDLANRLNSSEMEVRVRPAADMRCFIALVDHVIKRTPFRKELRMLRITQSIEEFYRSTSDLKEARHQAENFMNRRLRRMFPDMSTDESNEIKQRGAEMIDVIEQKILEERRAEVETQRQKTEEASAASKGLQDEGGDGVEDDLTEEEKAIGVFLGRVEMRVAGNYRRVPYKIMPDEEEPERFIIVQRDPDTGELVPQMRRGAKRFVEKDTRDGVWKAV